MVQAGPNGWTSGTLRWQLVPVLPGESWADVESRMIGRISGDRVFSSPDELLGEFIAI